MAHDVFVSYSVKDKTTADAICATLEANGIRVWIAPRDVMPGSDWGESIIEAIEQSKVMILVFSANSNASPQIKREIERSVNKGVTVVPFRIDDIMPSKTLEYFISTQHWLDAFTPPLEKHLDSLVAILRSIITKQGDGGAAPRLQPHPPEEDDAPARPEPPVAPSATPHKTITVKISTRKILVIALGLLIGVALAGGAVWWLVYKGPATQTAVEKNLGLPAGISAEDAAREYFQKGKNAQDVNEKITLFTKAIELNPKPGYYYIQRGRAFLAKQDYHKALVDLDKAVEAIPNSFAAYNLRGLAYEGLDRQAQAMTEFNKAISLNPAYAEAYSNRGFVFYEDKEYDKALQDYNKAIALDPNLANAYNLRGFLYAAQDKLGQALKDYNQATSLDPKLRDAFINRGNLYLRQKNYDAALIDFNTALPLNWRHAVTYNARGEVFAAKGDFEWARNDFNQAISLNPNYGKAYKNRGRVYLETGEDEKALNDFTKAIFLNTDLAETYELRGKLYKKRGDEERARQDFDKAKALK
ncbi:MAG TPA: tetratricopeptide repeat protein [Desulfobaccales bacterium]|nr:tetratricopeptide repeat protein [Desulfobaccales bacterium]